MSGNDAMKSILIVDDQPYLQELLMEELKDEGHNVEAVTDAISVRRHLGDSKPDLVLLDLYLKGFEGWDVLDDIKSKYPYLPVVIVTAYDNYAEDPRLSKADGYIVKNLDVIEKWRFI
jgi:CheY-like chemotaxis protein